MRPQRLKPRSILRYLRRGLKPRPFKAKSSFKTESFKTASAETESSKTEAGWAAGASTDLSKTEWSLKFFGCILGLPQTVLVDHDMEVLNLGGKSLWNLDGEGL